MSKDYKKLYEEALERAKIFKSPFCQHAAEVIFPELRESEDERIRKEIVAYLDVQEVLAQGKDGDFKEWIAWLEKKKEIETEDFGEFINELSKQFPEVSFAKLSRIAVRVKNWLEKQDTKLQEYINEERNKKDFYCEGKEMSWNEMSLGVRKHDYPYYFKGDLDCYPFNVEKQGEQKAEIKYIYPKFKIGDVIEPIKQKGFYRHVVRVLSIDKKTESYYCEYEDKKSFLSIPIRCEDEYKLVEQKPAWSEEDEYQINTILHGLDLKRGLYKKEGNKVEEERYKTQYDWLKSIKDRVQPQLNQEWSEEDEEMYKEVLTDIIYAKNDLKTKGCLGLSKRAMKAFNWFSKRHKSLRPQSKWKPSEEQLRAIINSAQGLYQCKEKEVLLDLYEQLKNL